MPKAEATKVPETPKVIPFKPTFPAEDIVPDDSNCKTTSSLQNKLSFGSFSLKSSSSRPSPMPNQEEDQTKVQCTHRDVSLQRGSSLTSRDGAGDDIAVIQEQEQESQSFVRSQCGSVYEEIPVPPSASSFQHLKSRKKGVIIGVTLVALVGLTELLVLITNDSVGTQDEQLGQP